MRQKRKHPGQALVELALAITFISLLLAAAVDLALAYRTHQMLVNATAEAASYLSQQPLLCVSAGPCTQQQLIDTANNRAIQGFRREIGTNFDANRTARLLDLDADGLDDVGDEGFTTGTFRSGNWIRIDPADSTQFNPNDPGAFNIRTFAPSQIQSCIDRNRRHAGGQCFVAVRSTIIYRPFFALTPIREFRISAWAIKPIVGGP